MSHFPRRQSGSSLLMVVVASAAATAVILAGSAALLSGIQQRIVSDADRYASDAVEIGAQAAVSSYTLPSTGRAAVDLVKGGLSNPAGVQCVGSAPCYSVNYYDRVAVATNQSYDLTTRELPDGQTVWIPVTLDGTQAGASFILSLINPTSHSPFFSSFDYQVCFASDATESDEDCSTVQAADVTKTEAGLNGTGVYAPVTVNMEGKKVTAIGLTVHYQKDASGAYLIHEHVPVIGIKNNSNGSLGNLNVGRGYVIAQIDGKSGDTQTVDRRVMMVFRPFDRPAPDSTTAVTFTRTYRSTSQAVVPSTQFCESSYTFWKAQTQYVPDTYATVTNGQPGQSPAKIGWPGRDDCR